MTAHRRIGICLGRNAVAAVFTDGRSIAAQASESVSGGVTVSEALRQCLAVVRPKRAWRRIECHVALEPSLVQVKRLTDLPVLQSARERLSMLELVAGEHFLGNVGALSLVAGEAEAAGGVWVFAVDRALLLMLATELTGAGFTLRALTPVIDLLAATSTAECGAVERREPGGTVAYGVFEHGRLTGAWRASVSNSAGATPAHGSGSAVAIDERSYAEMHAAAHAAALAPSRSRFAHQTFRAGGGRNRATPLRALIAIASCLTLAALVAPGLRARYDANRVEREIQMIAPTLSEALSQRRAADSQARLQTQITQFRSSGVRGLRVLSQVSELLTDDAYVTALSVDSVSAQATFAAPSATELLESFASGAAFDSVSLVGAVSREAFAPGQMASGILASPAQSPTSARGFERISLRFVTRQPKPSQRSGAQTTLSAQRPQHAAGDSVLTEESRE